MTNSKSTKRALLTSALALLMCVAMLIGATFAWFTDTASTGVNKIQAGNLDIELAYKNSTTGGEFKEANKETLVFDNNALWEPGHVEYVVLKVSNAGSLALKYKLGINIANEVGSTNVDGNAFKLSDYIRFAVLDGDRTGDSVDRDALVAAATDSKLIKEGYTAENHLTATGTDNSQKVVTLVVWMPTTVGNEANYKKGAIAPSINLGINVVATQYTHENDSFDNQYDAKATYLAEDQTGLVTLLNGGNAVTLGKDIAPTETITVSGKVKSTLDLNGKTLANTGNIWSDNNWALVSAQNGANLTITGNGTFAAKENDCYAVDVQDGSTVTITSGTFKGNIHAVYVLEGTAIIQGGFYSVQQKYPDSAKADEFVLNCYDANRANGTAKIIVTGGTFVNFNPADCQAEGAHTNFVAKGYGVVATPQANGDVWYTVVAESATGKTFSRGTHTLSTGITATSPNAVAVKAENGANITITGGAYDGGKDGNNVCVWASSGSNVTIKDGTFTVGGDKNGYGNSVVYTVGGSVTIEGGFFYTDYQYSDFYYVLNQDNNTRGTITVKGGTFVNYDPSKGDDNLGGNFVADGYKVDSETQTNGDVWYTVVPK